MTPHPSPVYPGGGWDRRTEMRCLLLVPESEVDVLKLKITVHIRTVQNELLKYHSCAGVDQRGFFLMAWFIASTQNHPRGSQESGIGTNLWLLVGGEGWGKGQVRSLGWTCTHCYI